MAAPAPPRHPIQIAKHGSGPRTGGVLPIQPPPAKGAAQASSKSASKNAPNRLKILVRRLPPGLTEVEFYTALGEEWKLPERVDWASYVPGKISKDPAKPSKPSRAYLHLTKPEYLPQLTDKARNASFIDAKSSTNDASLLGPPSVEFAPCIRVPTSKPRKDARQGTIDQEQDFIDFLQELTNPIPKPTPVDSTAEKATKSDEKVVTPLIQFLRDKKANKGKEQATGKGSKHSRHESKDGKAGGSSDKKSTKGKENTGDKKSTNIKVEKATREAIKVLNKQANAKVATNSHPTTSNATPASPAAAQPAKPERKRERGNASAAAKILQRDLGLGGASGGRRKRDSAAASANSTKEQPSKASDTSTQSQTTAPASAPTVTPTPPTGPKAAQTPTGPAATRNQQKNNQSSAQSKASAPTTITPTATQAFLKHANPSQGVTETLLNEAFASFGTITKVEIDKKKGFAYIDFSEPEGLQKAIAASPVKVAQGQVVVLERKTGASLQNRNAKGGANTSSGRGGASSNRGGRGGRGRGGGRSNAESGSGKAAAAAAKSTPVTTNAPAVEATGAGT